MPTERRQDPRLKQWFDGSWRGASGSGNSRLSDVSVTGCFVNSLATPAVGDTSTITIHFGPSQAVSFEGEVMYVERGMGFGVRFLDVTPKQAAEVQRLLDTHKKASA